MSMTPKYISTPHNRNPRLDIPRILFPTWTEFCTSNAELHLSQYPTQIRAMRFETYFFRVTPCARHISTAKNTPATAKLSRPDAVADQSIWWGLSGEHWCVRCRRECNEESEDVETHDCCDSGEFSVRCYFTFWLQSSSYRYLLNHIHSAQRKNPSYTTPLRVCLSCRSYFRGKWNSFWRQCCYRHEMECRRTESAF